MIKHKTILAYHQGPTCPPVSACQRGANGVERQAAYVGIKPLVNCPKPMQTELVTVTNDRKSQTEAFTEPEPWASRCRYNLLVYRRRPAPPVDNRGTRSDR